ncbi:MAG: hypothetical protein JW761_01745 [Prolixibacteraceae bacterium]|nr:hypothetical protein [Prolixibacteraceae bacterium]
MKTIRSNKKGFGIHSPFVYHLVTNVLFPEAGFYVFHEIEKLKLIKKEKSALKLLFRLIHYFQPNNVFCEKEMTSDELNILKKADSEIVFKKTDSVFHMKNETERAKGLNFFILNEMPDFQFTNIPEREIWFFTKKTDKNKIKRIFEPLFEKQDGIIFIEFLYEDLIIFDKKIPSQHYVIK